MKESPKKHYEAPQLSVDTFKVEKGFALSNVTSRFFIHDDDSGDNDAYFGRDGYGTASGTDNTQQSWSF